MIVASDCPRCGCVDTEITNTHQMDGEIHYTCFCNRCNKTFIDIYELVYKPRKGE